MGAWPTSMSVLSPTFTARACGLSRWPWQAGQRTTLMTFSSCIRRGPAAVFLNCDISCGMTPSHLPECFQTLPPRCFHSQMMCASPLPYRSKSLCFCGSVFHGNFRSMPRDLPTPS